MNPPRTAAGAEAHLRRRAGAGTRHEISQRIGTEGGDQAAADARGDRRAAVCVEGREACEVERHRFRQDGRTLGVGAGQMSRVDSVKIAVMKAQESLAGSVVGSDAFFPFPDGVEEAAKAGAVAVIQPGGSVRDADVIAAAELGDGDGFHRRAAFPPLAYNLGFPRRCDT